MGKRKQYCGWQWLAVGVWAGMFLLAPGLARAQGAASSPPPPKITGPTLSPYQQARADAERKITNAPPRPPPGTELIGAHLSGERIQPLANLWDGVDDQGNLHVFVAEDPVLNDVGVFRGTAFPPSVNVVDMNDDQLPDLVVGDRYGYLWIYFNSGKKGNPQFTTNTLVPTFLSAHSRLNVADWDGDQDSDIILGTFFGSFEILPNIGTVKDPKFTTSMGIPRFCDDASVGLSRLMLTKGKAEEEGLGRARPSGGGGGSRNVMEFVLGIYMTPWVTDWNKDGKPDLIFGEGTYSANSVRIAFNTGSPGKASFNEDGVFFLAYGEGFEQLVPSVVDYNGDGIPDVMCGTRTGQIRLYKGAGRAVDTAHTFRGIKAPAAMDFDRNLLLDNLEVLETMTAPFPYDWNDDGLFDIVMGSTSGRILVALNRGTKTEPLFPRVEAIRGVNTDPDLVGPAQWSGTVGRDFHCNSAGYLSSEQEISMQTGKPPEKQAKDAPKPAGAPLVEDVVKPVEGKYFLYYRYMKDYPGWTAYRGSVNHVNWDHYYHGGTVKGPWTPGARGLSTVNVGTMTIGRNYVFSFSYILVGREKVTWGMHSAEGFTKYNREFDDYDSYSESRDIQGTPLTPTARGWQKMSMQFTCPGVQHGQALTFPLVATPGVGVAQDMTFSIGFQLPEGDCELFLDNFSLKEVGGGIM